LADSILKRKLISGREGVLLQREATILPMTTLSMTVEERLREEGEEEGREESSHAREEKIQRISLQKY